jgi:hypothetical protein
MTAFVAPTLHLHVEEHDADPPSVCFSTGWTRFLRTKKELAGENEP